MLIGEIPVAEITAADFSKLLVEQTSHRLGDPEVMVDLIRSSEKTIYVGGEAGRPSAVPCSEPPKLDHHRTAVQEVQGGGVI
jgi:protein involved in polysaccharide export with SLBB domain